MSYKIVKKGYKVDFDKIEEGYLSSGEFTHAENRNEARSILLKKIEYEGWNLKYCDDDITYINIPVVRDSEYDLVMFEGKEVVKDRIKDIIRERERTKKLNNILEDPTITHCYIKKGGYYKPGSCGYTDFRTRAGIFPKEDAVSSGMSCDELWIIPINIEEHNKELQDEIDSLKSRLIHTKFDRENLVKEYKKQAVNTIKNEFLK